MRTPQHVFGSAVLEQIELTGTLCNVAFNLMRCCAHTAGLAGEDSSRSEQPMLPLCDTMLPLCGMASQGGNPLYIGGCTEPTHICVLHLQFASLKLILEFETGFQQGLFEV
jgi:hypothetical protein